MRHAESLHLMQVALSALQSRQQTMAGFCHQWRAQTNLLASLPARYTQVMEDLLARLESGSWFAEESCSFSQGDVHAHLAAWLDKARQTMQKQEPA